MNDLATIFDEKASDLLGFGGQYSLGDPPLLHLYRSRVLPTVGNEERYNLAANDGTKRKHNGKLNLLCSFNVAFLSSLRYTHPGGLLVFLFLKSSYKLTRGVGNISFLRVTIL